MTFQLGVGVMFRGGALCICTDRSRSEGEVFAIAVRIVQLRVSGAERVEGPPCRLRIDGLLAVPAFVLELLASSR